MPERLTVMLALFLGLGVGLGWHRFRQRSKKTSAAPVILKVVEDKNNLKARILSALQERKRGRSLTELGRVLNVHFLRLMFPIKSLMDEGVIKKGKDAYVLA